MRALNWSTRALHALERIVLKLDFTSFEGMKAREIQEHLDRRLARVKLLSRTQLRRRVPLGLRRYFPVWATRLRKREPLIEYTMLLALPKCSHGTAREICKALGFEMPQKKSHRCTCRVCGRKAR